MKIHSLTIGEPIHELWPDNFYDLSYWCMSYSRHNKKPATLLNRFAIGLYQIHQGMGWQDGGVNKYESYAAGALHFIMCAEAAGIHLEDMLDWDLDIRMYSKRDIDYKALLYAISAAQQMLFYANPGNKTQRASRYQPDRLCKHLSWIVTVLVHAIPTELRQECFNVAGRIMTRELK